MRDRYSIEFIAILVFLLMGCSQNEESLFQTLDFAAKDNCDGFFKASEFASSIHYRTITVSHRQQLLKQVAEKLLAGNQAKKNPAIIEPFVSGSCQELYQQLGLLDTGEVDNSKTYELMTAALSSYLENLDPHSYYFVKDQQEVFSRQLAGELTHVKGLIYDYSNAQILQLSLMSKLTPTINGNYRLSLGVDLPPYVPIAAVLPQSSAFLAGIDDSTKLYGVNNVVVNADNANLLIEQISSQKQVELEIGEDDERRKVVIKDAEALMPTVTISKLYDQFLYIRLAHFNQDPDIKQGSSYALALHLNRQPNNLQGMLLDLSDNGGGSLQEAVNIAGLLSEEQPEICLLINSQRSSTMRNLGVKDECLAAKIEPLRQYTSMPIVILSNRASASASEALMLMLRKREHTLVVGDKSFGKGSSQRLFKLTERTKLPGMLAVTTALFHTKDRQTVQKFGIVPDLVLDERLAKLESLQKTLHPRRIYRESDYPHAIAPDALQGDENKPQPRQKNQIEQHISSKPDCHEIEQNCDRFYALKVLASMAAGRI